MTRQQRTFILRLERAAECVEILKVELNESKRALKAMTQKYEQAQHSIRQKDALLTQQYTHHVHLGAEIHRLQVAVAKILHEREQRETEDAHV